MRKLFISFILLIFAWQAHSQFIRADYKKAMELVNRPLIVALFDMEEEAGNHCDSLHMAWYNETIQKVFREHWVLSDSIIFMRSRRVASILRSKSDEYAVFSAGPSREAQQSSDDIFYFPSFTFMLYLSEDGKRFDSRMVDRSLYSSPLVPDIDMTGQIFRGKYIFKLSFASLAISESDMIFAINQFTYSIDQAIADKKASGGIYAKKIPKFITQQLQNKTLLIPVDLDRDGISKELVKKYYKHPFRMATDEDIEAAIINKAENTAYLHYLWSDQERMYLGTVIDAQSGQLLAVLGPGVARMNKAKCLDPGTSYKRLLRIKTSKLKKLSKQAK